MNGTKPKPPKYIYLQWYGADRADLKFYGDEQPDEISWCVDKIYDTDVAYRRVGRRSEDR